MYKKNKVRIGSLGFSFLLISSFLIIYGYQMGGLRHHFPDPSPPAGFIMPEVTQLTSKGSNRYGNFSPDGKRIAYISEERMQHTHPQVYILKLEDQQERRLTFQYGEITDVKFDPLGLHVYYSSSTDELKENPPFLRDALARISDSNSSDKVFTDPLGRPLPPTEVYRSSLDGHQITRLTQEPGFDGEISVRGQKNEIAFTTTRYGMPKVVVFNTAKGGLSKIGSDKENEFEFSPTYSPSGNSLVWVRFYPEENFSSLYIGSAYGSGARTIAGASGLYLHPSWSPDGERILFSSNFENPNNFEIYSIKPNGSCLRRLTYIGSNEFYPRLSPDGTRLLFTSDRSGELQVWITELPTTEPCAPAESEPTIET